MSLIFNIRNENVIVTVVTQKSSIPLTKKKKNPYKQQNFNYTKNVRTRQLTKVDNMISV